MKKGAGMDKKNPLSSYGVTDEEFAFFEKVYEAERKAYWKGAVAGYIFTVIGYIIAAIVRLIN